MPWTEVDLLATLQQNRDLRERNRDLLKSTSAPPRIAQDEPGGKTRVAGHGNAEGLLSDSEGISRYRVKRSKTEVRYAELLDLWQHEGRIYRWWYEPQKGLYLAPKTSYTPDFLVQRTPERANLEFHEVKGAFIRPQDWIKAKQAAALYPCYIFILAQWKGGVWHHKLIPSQ